MYHPDTIAAVATPVGVGGIGIVKISGPHALQIISPFFRSASFNLQSPKTHCLYYGIIFDPQDRCELDEVLVSYMRGPSSYTGEDVVEINCHSGLVVLQQVLELVIKGGARPAEPGEFTKRAFLNGRIDLTQAEAVVDIIDSKTEASLKLASRQLRGNLAQKVHKTKQALLEITSFIEVSIDFPEDDLEVISARKMELKVARTADEILKLISTYEEGSLYRLGIHAVIVGKHNVGKSSILNALLGDNRAIVTSIPGTTRDVIQETINIQGIPVKLLDTAGLRHSDNEIEKIGIDITLSKISEADLVLLVLDGSTELDNYDQSIIERVKNKKIITVINKSDLPQVLSIYEMQKNLPFKNAVQISALYHHGIEELKDRIAQGILQYKHNISSDILISNARHKSALEKTYNSLKLVQEGFQKELSPELIAVDLQAALNSLGELTGETTTEDILDAIFSKFCIGK